MIEDLKHALRIYLRTPVAGVVAIGVLAIGMAFVACFVSLYVDLILRPHPGFEESNRLVTIMLTDGRNIRWVNAETINRISREAATLDALAGTLGATFEHDGTPQPAELVTRDFFTGIKPRLARGRGFLPEEHEPDSELLAVISYPYWQDAFDGREDVLGTTIELKSGTFFEVSSDGPEPEPKAFRIVGVMAPEFVGVRSGEPALWLPFEPTTRMLVIASDAQLSLFTQSVRTMSLRAVGTRKRGATTAAIASELDARFADGTADASPSGLRFDAIPGLVPSPLVQRSTQRQLQLFLGASVLVAVVAAANVSLFLLARAPNRRRELGIRTAVGAPARRLSRQLATEAGVLVMTGAALGLALSVWLAELLRGSPFLRQTQWRNVTLLDWRVLAIVSVFLTVLTLLVSMAPILEIKRGVAASSRQVSARATAAQRIAGTAQIAIAGVLCGAALAFVWYLGSVLLAYPGYQTRNLYGLPYSLLASTVRSSEAAALARTRMRETIAALPGVTALSLTDAAPGARYAIGTTPISHALRPGEALSIYPVSIDARYASMLGLRVLYGRTLNDDERDAAVVNRRLARELFGRDDVVGETFALDARASSVRQIVGVVQDFSFEHPLADVPPTAFMTESPNAALVSGLLLIESTQGPSALESALKNLLNSGALEIRSVNIISLAAARRNLLAPDRARSLLTIAAATLVVVLAIFGFYGTQRYLVVAGRREYAIRAALGAGPGVLGRLVVTRGLALGLPGLVLGLPFAFIIVAWLRDDYVSRDVSPAVVTLAVALGLVALLLVASIGPARHARATQPAPLLRED